MKGCAAFILLLLLSQVCAAQGSPNYVGFFDAGDCDRLAGWAADRNRLNTPISVNVLIDSTPFGPFPANLPRSDVGQFLGDNGQHGFFIPFPPSLKDTHPHTVSVRFETTNVELSTSPKTVGPCVTPPEGTGAQVRLELTFNIGAETTTSRLVGLHFSAVERAAGATNPVVANVTEYRVREVGLNEPLTSISASPWQHVGGPVILELGERNDFGVRYGERRILLQVKSADGLISDVASDTITLEPRLKDYTVHANPDHTNPLIQYAASQGFTFQRTFFQPCRGGSGGGSPADISSGLVFITGGALPCPPGSSSSNLTARSDPQCETRFEYELFGGRELNKFWRIKSVNVSGGDLKPHGANRYLLKGHVTAPPACNDCPQGTQAVNSLCVPDSLDPSASIGDIVIEGPAEDDFVSAANPWENAFVKPLHLNVPPPGTRPGFPPHD